MKRGRRNSTPRPFRSPFLNHRLEHSGTAACSRRSGRFSALEKSGKADQLAASADLASVQSFGDWELRLAVQELNRSTDSIARQTEALKQQQESLSGLLRGKAKEAEGRQALELKYAQAQEIGRKDLASAVRVSFTRVLCYFVL